MFNPLVSIIIPTYNRSHFLIETLRSIQNQSYINWECIVVDDGGNDDTEKVVNDLIKKDNRFVYMKRSNQFLKGANGSRNCGLFKAKGELVNWFDDDDFMEIDFIESKVEYFKSLSIDYVINSGSFTDKNLNNKKKITLFQTKNIYQDYFQWKLKILTPSVMFRKKFMIENGYSFDETLSTSHEFDLFTKIFSSVVNINYIILNDSTFLYRGHPQSTTSANQNYNKQFKNSESIALIRNFNRSTSNKEIYQGCFRMLINLLKKGLQNKDFKNVDFIKENILAHAIKNKFLIKLGIIALELNQLMFKSLLPLDKIIKKTPII